MQRLRTVGGGMHCRSYVDRNVYVQVRALLGYTQLQSAQRIGISRRAWQGRERTESYRADELIGLYRLSRLSPANFLKLLEKCR